MRHKLVRSFSRASSREGRNSRMKPKVAYLNLASITTLRKAQALRSNGATLHEIKAKRS